VCAAEAPADVAALEELYAELQAHLGAERWIESIAVCYRILGVEPGYRDVPQLLERSRHQLALERERSRTATEAWRGAVVPAMRSSQPGPGRWRVAFFAALGILLLVAALIVLVPRLREQPLMLGRRSEPRSAAKSAEIPSAPVSTADMLYYASDEGRFLLKYPQGWVVQESPSEGQSVRIVIITPEARDEPERITVVFARGGGQSPEQVWVSGLGFMQSVHNEDAEDWLLGEAYSITTGGHHARQIPFRYTHVKSGTEWQGLVTGVVHDSMNYALVAEAPTSRWPWAWSFFEPILGSIQFQ
jgi:hypothetical protein